MTQRTNVQWPTCDQDGCIGIRLASARMCLAHGSEEETAAALKLVRETGVIDARGVPITPALLERVLTAAPRGKNGDRLIYGCQFDGATFSGDARFSGTTFNTEHARFKGTTFSGAALFEGVTFSGAAQFDGATFSGGAWFSGATFTEHAQFERATFSGETWFNGATFTEHAWFSGATFSGTAVFGEVTFKHAAVFSGAAFRGVTFERAAFSDVAGFQGVTFSDTWFSGGTFRRDARFDGATFSGTAGFDGTTFKHTAGFGRATFEQARQFGPLLAYRGLVLDDVQFAQPVQIEVSTPGMCCRRARFPGGVQFRLRWARVVLDDTDLPAPSILAGVPAPFSEDLAKQERQIARAWVRLLAGEISERPQLLSLRRANVAGLGLSNVSADNCRFEGAHNLDKLRLESSVSFATDPPLVLGERGGGRQVIAEERAWRSQRFGSRRWVAPLWPDWLRDHRPRVLEPGQIAGLYRALRKGREDTKDEPGAADFYYGEMEMRRHAGRLSAGSPAGQSGGASRGRMERGILWAYWLVSGYSLRAWRAVAWLAVITALLALAFHYVGFTVPPHPVSYWTSLLYAFRATLSLTDNEVRLTAWGGLLQGILRLTGPVLLGLALLALRGRVKR